MSPTTNKALETERDRYREALEEIANHDPGTCRGIGPEDCFDEMVEVARAVLATEPATEGPQRG